MLPDEATILGVLLEDDTVVVKESLGEKPLPSISYTAGRSTVWTLLVDQIADALLVGEENEHKGRVVQYDLASGRVTKDYGSLGVGALLASTRLGSLCFFGGVKSLGFAVVDTLRQEIVQGPVKTAVRSIDSMAAWSVNCGVSGIKAVLSVSGRKVDYSNGDTDMFDVTALSRQRTSRDSLREFAESLKRRESKLEAKVRELERQLQQQAEAHRQRTEAKESVIRQLRRDNRTLLDALRVGRLQREKNRFRLVNQNLILGLAGESLHEKLGRLPFAGSQREADFDDDLGHSRRIREKRLGPGEPFAPETGDTRLSNRLGNIQVENQFLTERNRELQNENLKLRTKIQTLERSVIWRVFGPFWWAE